MSIPNPSDHRENLGTALTLCQVADDLNDRVSRGDLVDFVPLSLGFDPLDGMIGGGIRKTELILVGGAPGTGKSAMALQLARSIAMRSDQYVCFVSYQHPNWMLFNQLFCMESVNPPEIILDRGVRYQELGDLIVGSCAHAVLRAGDEPAPPSVSLTNLLQEDERTSAAMMRLQRYSSRLIFVRGHPTTTIQTLRFICTKLAEVTGGNLTLVVDYLQKVGIAPNRAESEDERTTYIVEGLKDIAMSVDIPVIVTAAADRQGLRAQRLHLHHLRGSSALDYECDIAIIVNNKYRILSRDHIAFNPYMAHTYRNWVVLTIEKNRAGRSMMNMEFEFHAPYFAFDPRGQMVQHQLVD